MTNGEEKFQYDDDSRRHRGDEITAVQAKNNELLTPEKVAAAREAYREKKRTHRDSDDAGCIAVMAMPLTLTAGGIAGTNIMGAMNSGAGYLLAGAVALGALAAPGVASMLIPDANAIPARDEWKTLEHQLEHSVTQLFLQDQSPEGQQKAQTVWTANAEALSALTRNTSSHEGMRLLGNLGIEPTVEGIAKRPELMEEAGKLAALNRGERKDLKSLVEAGLTKGDIQKLGAALQKQNMLVDEGTSTNENASHRPRGGAHR